MKKFLLTISLAGICAAVFAQLDLRSYPKPISTRSGSTMLSIFNACPESPDGKYLCYVNYKDLHKKEGQIIIQERATGKERVISDAHLGVHNGANAVWIDNRLIAAQSPDYHHFEVFDAQTGKVVFGPIDGDLPHKSVGGLLFFARNAETSSAPDLGVWVLDTKTGKQRKVISQDDLYQALHALNSDITDQNVILLHTDPSPTNDRVAIGYRYGGGGDEKRTPVLAYFNSDRSGITDFSDVGMLKNRPMHPLWYDNDTFMGVFTGEPEKRISRYNLAGDRIEILSGTSTHEGVSPDRQWYVGEGSYYKPDSDGYNRVWLRVKDNEQPVALLAQWKENEVTWKLRAHVSASFSNDGKRIYFNRGTDDDRSEAVVFELQDYLDKVKK